MSNPTPGTPSPVTTPVTPPPQPGFNPQPADIIKQALPIETAPLTTPSAPTTPVANAETSTWLQEVESTANKLKGNQNPSEMLTIVTSVTDNFKNAATAEEYVTGVSGLLKTAHEQLILLPQGSIRDSVLHYVEALRLQIENGKIMILLSKTK